LESWPLSTRNVAQDGSYSAILFNGSYKMVFPKGRGPFKTLEKDATAKDTLFVKLSGNQTLDVEVMPYYMIRTPQFSGGKAKFQCRTQTRKNHGWTPNAKDIERGRIICEQNRIRFPCDQHCCDRPAGSRYQGFEYH
jgi:hypothetical protein